MRQALEVDRAGDQSACERGYENEPPSVELGLLDSQRISVKFCHEIYPHHGLTERRFPPPLARLPLNLRRFHSWYTEEFCGRGPAKLLSHAATPATQGLGGS